MGKKFRTVTPERQDEWYKEHVRSRETGVYKPYIRIEDLSSFGNKSKLPHYKDPYRLVHLLSVNERFMYLELIRDRSIDGLYEQWAISLLESLRIAEDLDISHPRYPRTNIFMIQTLDFYCPRVEMQPLVVAVKDARDAEGERTKEKIEIQREFARRMDYEFRLATSDTLKTQKHQNFERVWRHASLPSIKQVLFKNWLNCFIDVLAQDRHARAAHILDRSAELSGITLEIASHLLFHAVWIGKIKINWDVPFALYKAASELGIQPNAER